MSQPSTKVISTPTGVKEVYDPSQGEDVRAAFSRLFKLRQRYFSKPKKWRNSWLSINSWEYKKQFKSGLRRDLGLTLIDARQRQVYDVMRAGCKIQEDLQCADPRKYFGKEICSEYAWGSSELSACEQQEIQLVNPIPEVVPSSTCWMSNESRLQFYIEMIGDGRFGSESEQFSKFFARECRVWANFSPRR